MRSVPLSHPHKGQTQDPMGALTEHSSQLAEGEIFASVVFIHLFTHSFMQSLFSSAKSFSVVSDFLTLRTRPQVQVVGGGKKGVQISPLSPGIVLTSP